MSYERKMIEEQDEVIDKLRGKIRFLWNALIICFITIAILAISFVVLALCNLLK